MFEPRPTFELTVKVAVHGCATVDDAADFVRDTIDSAFVTDTLEIAYDGIIVYEPEPIKGEEAA